MIRGIDSDIRALEECQKHNDHEIERLLGLCDALLHREANSTNASEIDDIRAEISAYRDRISKHEADNTDTAAKLRELRDRAGA